MCGNVSIQPCHLHFFLSLQGQINKKTAFFLFSPFALSSLNFDVKFLSNCTQDRQFQTTGPVVLLCYGLRGLLGCSESLWWVHPQAVLNVRGPQSFPPAEDVSTVLPRRELWKHLSCLWKLSLSGSVSLQDELSALKDKLEQKEAEVKRLHEKLVCKLKGEGIEILDRGKKKGGSVTVSSSVTSSEVVFPRTGNN